MHHVSASSPFHPGRSDFPSPVDDLDHSHFIISCRKTHKLACGMNGIRSERVFLEGGSPLIVDRASLLGLSAVYWSRSHRACSVVVHCNI